MDKEMSKEKLLFSILIFNYKLVKVELNNHQIIINIYLKWKIIFKNILKQNTACLFRIK